MADLKQLETALINADKAGDVEAAKALAGEIMRVRQGPGKPLKLGAEAMPESIAQVSDNFSGLSKAAVGAAGAVNKAAMRLKQVAGRDLTQEDIQGLKEYKALSDASGEAMAGDIGMNILATLQPGAALFKGAAALAGKVLPKFLAPAAGAAVSGAGITAATSPTMDGETSLGNAAEGAGGAVAADVLTRGASRAVRPIVQSEPVQKLVKEGVVPSVGQAVGGLVNRVEQQLESVPVVGWLISNARGRAVKEFDEAAIRKALPDGSAETIKAGRDGVERAGAVIDNAYDAAYGRITGKVKTDDAFKEAISGIPSKEGIDLPPSLKERFDVLVKDRVLSKLDKGADAESLRAVQNSLGSLARKYRGSGDPDQRALGQAFAEAKSKFRELVSRQSSGEFKPTLDALDSKYSALLAIEKASGYTGSKEGIFSAEALQRASKKATPEFRQFASEGVDVLGRTVPDSGTGGRALLPLATYAAAGGAGGTNEYLGGPGWLTGALAAPLLFSRTGSKYMLGGYPGQQTLGATLRELSPYFSQVGRAATQ